MSDLIVRMHVLPGGKMPERKTDGAVGFDAYLRALISPTEMDPEQPQLRKTLFDFKQLPTNSSLMHHIIDTETVDERAYMLQPGELVLGGIGIITEFDFPVFMGIWPRSGMLIKNRIDVSNAPGTVDPDYRGEAGVLIENKGDHPFELRRGMRIAQLIFQQAIIPQFDCVNDPSLLTTTTRQAGGFGSTGLG